MTKQIWGKMNKEEGITLPNFNTCQVASVIKTMWYWQRKRHKNQWNRIRNPDINLKKYTQLIFSVVVGYGQKMNVKKPYNLLGLKKLYEVLTGHMFGLQTMLFYTQC